MPRRIPPDVARVVSDFRDLGEAARRALHVSEQVTRWQVEQAARRADEVERWLRRRGHKR